MTYRLVLFDFDGTLADSLPFFVAVFNQIADRHRFARIDPAEVPALRHLDARQMMARVGMPRWKLPFVARSFLALMRRSPERIPLFPGIPDALRRLAEDGTALGIVTSNAEDNVRAILGPGLAGLFQHYECGASIFGKRRRLSRVLRRAGVAPHQALYVGDQATDLEAARSAGLAFAAVGWGYGDLAALTALRPDHALNSVEALGRLGMAAPLYSSHPRPIEQ